jgi:hypothetical protein
VKPPAQKKPKKTKLNANTVGSETERRPSQ